VPRSGTTRLTSYIVRPSEHRARRAIADILPRSHAPPGNAPRAVYIVPRSLLRPKSNSPIRRRRTTKSFDSHNPHRHISLPTDLAPVLGPFTVLVPPSTVLGPAFHAGFAAPVPPPSSLSAAFHAAPALLRRSISPFHISVRLHLPRRLAFNDTNAGPHGGQYTRTLSLSQQPMRAQIPRRPILVADPRLQFLKPDGASGRRDLRAEEECVWTRRWGRPTQVGNSRLNTSDDVKRANGSAVHFLGFPRRGQIVRAVVRDRP
jgi:hypothetical protein